VALDLGRLTAALAALGGISADAGAGRRPLTWSAHSATTYAERELDEKTGRFELTGKVTATVQVQVTVRALGLMDALGAALTQQQHLHVHAVSWHVDADNPAWPDVRAAAIGACVRKARDYAAALGGTLHQVEHIADAGLLGAAATGREWSASSMTAAARHVQEDPDTPALDPVPQELTATIEARFSTAGVSLAGH
ncbi:MAG: SIMPL domain-containing protein, partial [Actinomycetota bacterium]